jgi:hypothetical protein
MGGVATGGAGDGAGRAEVRGRRRHDGPNRSTARVAQACSLSVDVVQRQRHAAPTTGGWSGRRGRGGFLFGELRSAPAAMALKDGPRAAGASGRDLRVSGALFVRWRGAAAAARGDANSRMERPPGPGGFLFGEKAVGAGGAQGWTSSCGGERPRPTGSRRDRRAVAHSGWSLQLRRGRSRGIRRSRPSCCRISRCHFRLSTLSTGSRLCTRRPSRSMWIVRALDYSSIV